MLRTKHLDDLQALTEELIQSGLNYSLGQFCFETE